jgi:hypothetical protein
VARVVVSGARGEAARHQVFLALEFALVVVDVHLGLRQVGRALAVRGAQGGDLAGHVVEVGGGLRQRDAVRFGVELHQQLARADQVVFVHGDGGHPAADFRADAHLRGLDVGVLGAGVALAE